MLIPEDTGKPEHQDKNFRVRTRTNNKFHWHMAPSSEIEPGPHWCKAISAFTTAPYLLPYLSNSQFSNISSHNLQVRAVRTFIPIPSEFDLHFWNACGVIFCSISSKPPLSIMSINLSSKSFFSLVGSAEFIGKCVRRSTVFGRTVPNV